MLIKWCKKNSLKYAFSSKLNPSSKYIFLQFIARFPKLCCVFWLCSVCTSEHVMLVFCPLTAGMLNEIHCMSREAFLLKGSWCILGFPTEPGRCDTHNALRQKYEALSLPTADPTYSVQDILWTPPYRTALPRSYKIRVTCLKAMNGKRQSPGPPQFHCAGLTAHDSRQTAIVISEVYSSWRMQSPPYW